MEWLDFCLKRKYYFILYVILFCLLVCLWHSWVHCPQRPKEGIESPGIGDIDICEPARGTGNQTQNYLDEKSGILTTELFIQIQITDIFCYILLVGMMILKLKKNKYPNTGLYIYFFCVMKDLCKSYYFGLHYHIKNGT